MAVTTQQATDTAVRPFTFEATDAELEDLRARILATRWPEKETVADQSQGVPLAMIKELASHWMTDYDWRTCEARLNAFPQFVTEIDGLDIHFIHGKSKEKNALPMIITHGWPGSFAEFLDIIEPLSNPRSYGGDPATAYHLVIPSIPGFGFSGPPSGPDENKSWEPTFWRA